MNFLFIVAAKRLHQYRDHALGEPAQSFEVEIQPMLDERTGFQDGGRYSLYVDRSIFDSVSVGDKIKLTWEKVP
jgi:hypothetical protein